MLNSGLLWGFTPFTPSLRVNVFWYLDVPLSSIQRRGIGSASGVQAFVSGLESWKLGRSKHWKWSVKWRQTLWEDRKVEGQAFKNDKQYTNVLPPFSWMRDGYVSCLPRGPTLLQYYYGNFYIFRFFIFRFFCNFTRFLFYIYFFQKFNFFFFQVIKF